MAFKDCFTLYSPLIKIEGCEVKTANLPVQPFQEGIVTGIVQQPDGVVIPNATVKIFRSNGQPFMHENTNSAGRFIFLQIPAGSYTITASEPGFLTPVRIPISVIANRTLNVIITMQPDPDANKNAVFGIVRNNLGQPIENATVELYQITGTTTTLIGIVMTNSSGQYLICQSCRWSIFCEDK